MPSPSCRPPLELRSARISEKLNRVFRCSPARLPSSTAVTVVVNDRNRPVSNHSIFPLQTCTTVTAGSESDEMGNHNAFQALHFSVMMSSIWGHYIRTYLNGALENVLGCGFTLISFPIILFASPTEDNFASDAGYDVASSSAFTTIKGSDLPSRPSSNPWSTDGDNLASSRIDEFIVHSA